jgi:hypothetical protein
VDSSPPDNDPPIRPAPQSEVSPPAGGADDDLVARLQSAAGTDKAPADPFLSLPVATEVRVNAEDRELIGTPRCDAAGRKALPFGYYGYQVTDGIRCELRLGHTGAHMAQFSRSRWTRRWHALTWAEDH